LDRSLHQLHISDCGVWTGNGGKTDHRDMK